jgi:hypothetical protein
LQDSKPTLHFETLTAKALQVCVNPFTTSILAMLHDTLVSQLLRLRTRTTNFLLRRIRSDGGHRIGFADHSLSQRYGTIISIYKSTSRGTWIARILARKVPHSPTPPNPNPAKPSSTGFLIVLQGDEDEWMGSKSSSEIQEESRLVVKGDETTIEA